jgi:hypothetical protein
LDYKVPMKVMKQLAPRGLTLAAIFFLTVQTLGTLAYGAAEGPGVGGGGGAVLCLNPDQTIRSVLLVDLEESAFYDKTKPSKYLETLS